jgi:hypothetical protein
MPRRAGKDGCFGYSKMLERLIAGIQTFSSGDRITNPKNVIAQPLQFKN